MNSFVVNYLNEYASERFVRHFVAPIKHGDDPSHKRTSSAVEVAMIKPIFKQAKPEDVEEVLSFIQAYYAFDDIPFRSAEVAAALRVLLSNVSLGQVWIIGTEEKAVGYTILTFGFDLEFGGSVATVTELYIESRFRRCGIGRQAIQFLENICRELEITGLELQVERDNPEAQEFYRSLGFQAHERIPLSKRLVTPTDLA